MNKREREIRDALIGSLNELREQWERRMPVPACPPAQSGAAPTEAMAPKIGGKPKSAKAKRKLPRGIRRRGNSLLVYLTFPDGHAERRSLGNVTVGMAGEQRRVWQRQIKEGSYIKRQPKTCMVADLFKPYMLDFSDRGARDARRWNLAWKRLAPMFGRLLASTVSTSHINAYIAMRRAMGRSNGTINRELTLLKALLRFGARQTPPMVERVMAFPKRLKESDPRKGFVEYEQYALLASNARELWLRALIAVAYTYGFRKSELLNLRVGQVDLLNRWISLEAGTTKNGDARSVKMTSEVFELMRACCHDKKRGDFVFTRADGSRVIDPRKNWYTLCVASGLGQLIPVKRDKRVYKRYVGLNLHDFRRAAVRNLVRAGVPERVCMDICGHRTRSIFDRYNITSEADLVQASKLIEAGRHESEQGAETDTKTDTPASRFS